MTSTPATVRVMSAEEIAARAGGAPAQEIRLPQPLTLFAERAMRLRQLAPDHALGRYLNFAADLALAQSDAARDLMARALPLPTPSSLAGARAVGRPPLPAVDWPRDDVWREVLHRLLDTLTVLPPGAETVAKDLRQWPAEALDAQADALLHGVMAGLDLAAAPFVGAALQVYFACLVAQTGRQHAEADTPVFVPSVDPSFCPCCGSRPVASVTRQVADVAGQRYLQCSLCAAEWHLVRIQCSHCGSGAKLAYQALQAVEQEEPQRSPALQAETCDECGHYLKIVHTDRDAFAEPAADDLASVTLDLLVSEAGYERSGINFLLLFGEPEPPDPGGS